MRIETMAIGFALVFSFNQVEADVSYKAGSISSQGGKFGPKIVIHGEIKNDDVNLFETFVVAATENAKSLGIPGGDKSPVMIELDSAGGSVAAAITIGTAIRELKPFSVVVQKNAVCVSACVFLLAGGVTRVVDGRVGIHRPYLEHDPADTMAGQKESHAAIEKRIRAYLSAVNVPTSLYDMMFRIPPAKVRFLSERELQDFNLNEDDPYYRDASDASWAKFTGLSKREYLQFDAEFKRTCIIKGQANLSKCYEDVLKKYQTKAVK